MYTLKVEKIVKETEDTVTISFRQPALRKVKYSAGQYLTLIFRINNRRYLRPYSFSSAPLVDTTLDVTVKRVPGGVVSNHIIDKVVVGDVVEVMPPMGDFVLSEQSSSITPELHIVLWGAGSGITPLMSIAKYALHHTANHITLVYGNRTFDSVIFKEKIEELKAKYPDRLAVWHYYTEAVIDNTNPYLIQGRINPKQVLDVMNAEGKLEDTRHYICGPAGLKESVKEALNRLLIPADNIHSEDFEITRNPLDFEDITTQNVTIVKAGTETIVEVVKYKSILESGLDAMLELDYSCQTGNCMLCKAGLIRGQVKTIGVNEMPEGLQPNEILMCCGFPLSDDVVLSV